MHRRDLKIAATSSATQNSAYVEGSGTGDKTPEIVPVITYEAKSFCTENVPVT